MLVVLYLVGCPYFRVDIQAQGGQFFRIAFANLGTRRDVYIKAYSWQRRFLSYCPIARGLFVVLSI